MSSNGLPLSGRPRSNGQTQGDDLAREPTDSELRQRLDKLTRDLQGEKREQVVQEAPQANSGNIALVFRFASEFVAGVLVGALLGWCVDWLLGTKPVFLIAFLLLGFGAALTNMVRVAKAAQANTPLGRDLPVGRENDEDA